MLQQNINTCNSIIGAPNYDIGHVFSTGGGGVAYLSCVCGSNKAGGVTGSGNPVGDPFDIDYVAHEMGHQYGGRHTQNNSCNRDNQSSYEPGSASTIMGYAGICSPNVQSNSDDYFHINSILLMSNFITGTGNSCATVTTTGNGQPTADAGPNYVIPRSTYFVLTGQGSDPDNDPLTYCWEQYDRQIAIQPPLPTNTQGPAFRSLDPTPSPLRYFPNLDAIVNNKDLQKAMAEAHDMSLWFSSTPFSESPDVQMGLSMAELDQDALKDNYVHGYMDFLPGKIEGKARLFLQPKLSKDLDKLFNDKVSTDFSKYIPNDQVSMLLVNAINIKGIDEVLSARSQSKGFLDFSLKQYDLSVKDFREAFGGDIALAAVGQEGSDRRIGMFATKVLDKKVAQKFIDKAMEGGALEKEPGDVYKLTGNFSGTGNFSVTFDDNSPRLLIRDDILFITGDEMWIEKIQAGGFPRGERIKGERADRLNDHLFYAFFDGKGLVSFNKESADLSVKDTEIKATRGEVSMTVRMNDEKTNALKAMFESAERKYEEERREIQ